jgi:hypothetical protein
MRKFIILYLGFWGSLHAQCPVLGVERPNVIFYGYNNRMNFGTQDGRPFVLEGVGAEVTKEADGSYLLMVLREKNIKVLFKDPDTGIPFDTLHFKASFLPSPQLYFGTAAQGENAHKSTTVVFAKYPPEIPLTQVTHKILSMEVYVGDHVFHISGNALTDEAQKAVKEQPSEATLYCIATVSTSGFVYKISGAWKLI